MVNVRLATGNEPKALSWESVEECPSLPCALSYTNFHGNWEGLAETSVGSVQFTVISSKIWNVLRSLMLLEDIGVRK